MAGFWKGRRFFSINEAFFLHYGCQETIKQISLRPHPTQPHTTKHNLEIQSVSSLLLAWSPTQCTAACSQSFTFSLNCAILAAMACLTAQTYFLAKWGDDEAPAKSNKKYDLGTIPSSLEIMHNLWQSHKVQCSSLNSLFILEFLYLVFAFIANNTSMGSMISYQYQYKY